MKPFCIDIENTEFEGVEAIYNKMVSDGYNNYDHLTEYIEYRYMYIGVDVDEDIVFYNTISDYSTGNEEHTGKEVKLITKEEFLGTDKSVFDFRGTKIDCRKYKDGVATDEVDEELFSVVIEILQEIEEYSYLKENNWKIAKFIYVDLYCRFLHNDDVFEKHQNKEIKINFKRELIWDASFVPETEIITLPNGDKYNADDLQKALSNIKKLN